MAATDLHQAITDALRSIVSPLAEADDDPEALEDWLRDVGFTPDDAGALSAFVSSAVDVAHAVEALASSGNKVKSLASLLQFMIDSANTIEALRACIGRAPALAAVGSVDPALVVTRLLERLVVEALDRAQPAIVPSLVALGLAERWHAPTLASAPEPEGLLTREFTRLHVDRLPALLADPVREMKALYAPNGLETDEEALAAADRLMPALVEIARALGIEAAFGSPDMVLTQSADGVSARGALLAKVTTPDELASGGAGITLTSAERNGPGVAVAPFGEVTLDFDVGPWKAQLEFAAQVEALLLGPNGVRFFGDAGSDQFQTQLELSKADDAAPWVIGVPKGARLEVPPFGARAFLNASGSDFDAGAEIELKEVKLFVAAGEGDGFLSAVLPEAIELDFSFVFGGTRKRGLYIDGAAGASFTLVLNFPIAPLMLRSLTVDLSVNGSRLEAGLGVTGGLALGPIAVVVEKVGLNFLCEVGKGGNLGAADLAIGFKPPESLGLRIDAGVVKGGGFVGFVAERGEYSGVLELTLPVVSVKAIAILTTKRPDGSEGWALLLLIFGQFPTPVQLSYGFTLSGVGGLIGLHHGCDRPALESGMRTGAFDAILFPKDPVGDAPTIIGQLRTVFPIRPDSLVLGPMLELGWGTPNLVQLRLGLFVQLDHVFGGGPLSLKQILLLGQLEVLLPPGIQPSMALLRLLVDLLGYLDLEEQVAGFAARLRDSRVAVVTLSGMLVARISWGQRPSFVLAAGGFHPRFEDVPPGLPAPIDRVGAGFNIGPVKIALEGYFAITPATVQAGARIDAAAKLGPVELKGHFGFDTIFYFEPTFHFVVDAGCSFSVKYEGHSLTGVEFEGKLTGPGRWQLVGHAHFEVLLWKVSIDIDESWGNPPQAPALPSTNVYDLFVEDLGNAANWSAQSLPPGSCGVTLLAKAEEGEALAHPLGRLQFTQRRVPLGLQLERFGRSTIVGPQRIEVSAVQVAGVTVPHTATSEYFARSSFVELPKEQKLSGPSFELLPAGFEVGGHDFVVPAAVNVPLDFETVYMDTEYQDDPAPRPRDTIRHRLEFAQLLEQAAHGETARCALRLQEKLRPQQGARFRVTEPPLASASAETLRPSGAALAAAARYSPSLAAQSVAADAIVVEEFELVSP